MSVITDTQEIEVKGPVEPRRFRPGNTIGPISKVKRKYLNQSVSENSRNYLNETTRKVVVSFKRRKWVNPVFYQLCVTRNLLSSRL